MLGLVSLPHLPGHPLPAELRPHYVGLNRLPFNDPALSVKNYYSDGFGLGGVLCSVYWSDPFSRVLFFANNYSALRDAGESLWTVHDKGRWRPPRDVKEIKLKINCEFHEKEIS